MTLRLTGGMMAYDWGFQRAPSRSRPLEPVRAGERVRLDPVNTTTMWHPVHLHGHTFATVETGMRKDTIVLLDRLCRWCLTRTSRPWMPHCHNAYHAEAGMMTQLGYLR